MNEPKKLVELDSNCELPWPERGDQLVTRDGDASYLVRTFSGEEWETYVRAYRMAAEMLVERTHDMTLSINWLVFPIWYLYRHYLELRLKSLIWDGDAMERQPPRRLNATHGLLSLWRMCRKEIEKWQGDCPESDLEAVENTLSQFDVIDPKSQAARYPKDTAEMLSGLLGKEINLNTFVETVTKTANFLDATSSAFDDIPKSKE